MIARKRTLTRRCAICGRVYYGFGHVAEPVALGRCCDRCHAEAVLPERRRALRVVEDEKLQTPLPPIIGYLRNS